MERWLSVLEVESNESLLAGKNILGNIFDVFVRNLEKFRYLGVNTQLRDVMI